MIKEDFTFEFDESVLFSYAGRGMEKKLRDPKNKEILEEAKKDFELLNRPKVIWRRFPIEDYIHDKIILHGGRRMGSGPFMEVFTGAYELVLALCTVGPKLEEHAKALMKNGSMLRGIVLDGLASWAVDNLRCRFYTWCCEYFDDTEGYRCSTYLSPGESAWSIDDQRVIFDLLNEEIPQGDLLLTESNVMVPFKSLSMAFGIGPEKMGSEGGSNCDRCTMKDVCKFRKHRAV